MRVLPENTYFFSLFKNQKQKKKEQEISNNGNISFNMISFFHNITADKVNKELGFFERGKHFLTTLTFFLLKHR